MKRFWITFLLCLSGIAVAAGITAVSGLSSSTGQQEEIKSTLNALWSYAASLLSGEDETNSVFRVEQQMSYKNVPHADTVVKASAGFVHSVKCVGSDAAPTAGSIAFLDSATAGAGTTIFTVPVTTTAWLYPVEMLANDIVVTTGFVVDYTTTNDVDCVVSYR